MHKKPTKEEIARETARWEVLHGPVPKLPYKANEWRPSCDFHAYSQYEHPLATETGVTGMPL